MDDFNGLPGAELVSEGLQDQAAERTTVPALLVAIAGARLRRLGVPAAPRSGDDAELYLYRMLSAEDEKTAHGRYNSLLRRVDSFASSLERERSKQRRSI